jgi:hypothetical protein
MSDMTKISATKNGSKEITLANGAASQTIAISKDESFILYVRNTDAAAATITVAAGNGIASVMGSTSVAVAQNKEFILGPFESARFGNAGKLTVTITDSDGTEYGGTITNVKLAPIQL